jgi:hypothetical protein
MSHGADINKTPPTINTHIYHMARTCMALPWSQPLKTSSVSITVTPWLKNLVQLPTPKETNHLTVHAVGSKNPKIRYYGGSESNDFRVACAVALTKCWLRLCLLHTQSIRNRSWIELYQIHLQNGEKDIDRKNSILFKQRRNQLH